MRIYPTDSPYAAARLVALAMMADGHVSRLELNALRHAAMEAEIGVTMSEFQAVLQTFCEDLLISAQAHGSLVSCIDLTMLRALLEEIEDVTLQRKVMQTVVAVVAADGHLAESELHVMHMMQQGWRLSLSQGRPSYCSGPMRV